MFILLEGIKGTATQPGYEGWIPLRAITHNVGTAMFRGFRKKKAGKEKDEEEKDSEGGDIIVDETEDEAYHRRMRSERKDNPPGNPSLSELTISASFGPHLPLLFQLGALRRPLRRAVIEHVVGRLTTRYTLRNVFLSGFSISADDDEDERHHSLSLNYQGPIELMMEERVRRPLALPSTPGFTSFDPHKADSGSFSLPLELIVMTFGWLDQQSLARAAMVPSPPSVLCVCACACVRACARARACHVCDIVLNSVCDAGLQEVCLCCQRRADQVLCYPFSWLRPHRSHEHA